MENRELKNSRARRWRAKNKLKVRETNLKILYKITLKDYDDMLKAQDSKCLICGFDGPLVVDHCHKTNKIRGLLCSKCNKGIGLLKEDLNTILNAFEYIKKWKTELK